MAFTYCLCVGLLLVIQTLVHGQPVESPVSVEAAGEAAASAGAAAAEATSAGMDLAQEAGSALTDGVASMPSALQLDIGGMTGNAAAIGSQAANGLLAAGAGAGAAALNAGMAAGAAGLGAGAVGLGAGLAVGAQALDAGLRAGTGALTAGLRSGTGAVTAGLGTGTGAVTAGLGTGTGALTAGLGAGNAGLALSAQTLEALANSPILLAGSRYGASFGSGNRVGTLSTPVVRELIAKNAQDLVRAIDGTTGQLTSRSTQSMIDYGQALDALLANYGVDSVIGRGVTTLGANGITRGRDGTILVLQDGVDRLFGGTTSVADGEETPAAIVVG